MKAVCIFLLFLAVSNLTLAQLRPETPPHPAAQTITVRLLNAQTGKPMTNKMVTVRWLGGWDKSEIALDNQGAGTVDVPVGIHEFTLDEGPRVGKEPYRIAYLDCNDRHGAKIQVSLVMEKGFVPKNGCGDKTTSAHPGEVVLWGLPKPWWQPDMQ
jgi:hypothetical protein